MTLLLSEGFDIYDNITDISTTPGWTVVGGGDLFTTSGGRFGGGAIGSDNNSAYFQRALPTPIAQDSTTYFGFAFNMATYFAASFPFIDFIGSGGTILGGVGTEASNGNLTIFETGGTAHNSSTPVPTATWVWIEIKFINGSSSSNGTIQVKMNGTVILTVATANFSSGAETLAALRFPGVTTGGSHIDDLVVDDAGYLGDLRIDTLNVTADGSTMNWATSSGTAHNDVDDPLGASDGDTSFISSATPSQVAQFAMEDVTGSSSSIFGVQVCTKAKKTDSGARTYNGYIDSGTVGSGTARDPTTGYTWGKDLFVLDPNTSAAWIDSGVNGAQVGVNIAT